MRRSFITKSAKETKKLGEVLAGELHGGQIIALYGELGSGKTTFTQGFLKGLGVKGPYTSPTFLVIKHYKKEISKSKIQNIYHIDAYRVTAKDVLNFGWEEIIKNRDSIIIIEWADRIKKIVPENSLWIRFEWMEENKRKIIFM